MTTAGEPSEVGQATAGRSRSRQLALAICLATLAGWVDATAFIYFHGLFVSFMSGNSTQAAVALVRHDVAQVFEFGGTIALFVGGIIVGELIAVASGPRSRPVILSFEAACLCIATLVAAFQLGDLFVASLLAFSMGLQNAVLHKVGTINVGLTYVTGTLVQVGRSIARAVRGAAPLRDMLPFAGLWFGLACGGVGGGLVTGFSFVAALASASAICGVFVLWTFVEGPSRAEAA